MLRCRSIPDANGHAGHQGHTALAAKHVAVFGGLVDDFIHAAQGKVDHAHLHHRAHARQRHAHAAAHDGRFTDRGVDDAVRAKGLLQAFVLAKDAAPSHVLAHDHHALVGFHFSLHGQHGGLAVTHRVQNH